MTTLSAQAVKNGLVTENGNTYYYQNGQAVKDYFLTQNGNTYYFTADGTMAKNYFYSNWGHTYYFQGDGARLDNGFYNNWGHTYYFQGDGARLDNGFYNNWGNTYYFQSDGARLDNSLYSNWGNQYYFDGNGALVKNANVTVNGVAYKAASDGVLTSVNDAIVQLALKLTTMNIPYVWGGDSLQCMDCSGLVKYVMSQVRGLNLPHNTIAQEGYLTARKAVSQAQPGDLLFWGGVGASYHVAIYIGNGKYVHAPQPGEYVKVGFINSYFMPSFAGTLR